MNEAKKPGVYKPADKLPQFNEFCMTFINVTLLLRNYLITLTYVLLDDTSPALYFGWFIYHQKNKHDKQTKDKK